MFKKCQFSGRRLVSIFLPCYLFSVLAYQCFTVGYCGCLSVSGSLKATSPFSSDKQHLSYDVCSSTLFS